MAFDIKGFASSVNETRLAVEEGRIVIVNHLDERKEYSLDGELYGIDSLFSKSLSWRSNGKKEIMNVLKIKSVNGIQKSNFE